MQAQDWLTLREAADALGISEVSARRWVKSGKLEAAQPGRKYLIPRSAVEDLLSPMHKTPLGEDAPQVTAAQFAERGIETTSAEIATVNALLETYTEMAQIARQTGRDEPRTFEIPEGPVNMERVHMLAYFAARSGILTQEDIEVLDTGVRTNLLRRTS